MHLILTGATGLVGGAVLDAMLGMPEITRISILSRRPVPQLDARIQANDPVASKDRVRVILHKDFRTYDDALLQNDLKGAAGVVWALGISQLSVSKDEYVVITKDYPLAAAAAFQKIPPGDGQGDAKAGDPFRFVYVSGEGAQTKPGRTTARFGVVKGQTELALANITNGPAGDAATAPAGRPFLALSVRPGGVDLHGHAALAPFAPKPPSLAYQIMGAALLPVLRTVYPGMLSPTLPLGTFLAETAMGKYSIATLAAEAAKRKDVEAVGSRFHIVNNSAFRRLMGL
ncbi:nucleoside-diphosphate-sugar epimerase [Sporothrix schenckii 1099-18]|uniref:Nucleoside-diphosphate-sugar epimerase n=1 Tax=Sporothrix schenckii 1099-18 TaxID=1397361 RepID=A0A0F2MCC2_SPOSC|nr:nucleoside-diphosphate-sugar epimerase [Sporothrix schenckii 1099-18]KJR87292.1 nucleoside-diphosphate-sugar epimerase [Sporothrix schenckii 1099-18]